MLTTQLSAPTAAFSPQTAERAAIEKKGTYGQILKSTAVIGGSSLVNVVVGVARAKAMALFLGPAGVGLMGLFSSIADLAQTLAGLGIQTSGVRQIAEAVGSGDAVRIARTVSVLRRVSILFGLIGGVILVLLAKPLSHLTFGSYRMATGVALLSMVVFFREVSAGQGALIQGMRRISDLAKISVLSTLFGVGITIPLVYFFREQGVVPSLVGVAAVSLLISWWYARKVKIQAPSMTLSDVRQEVSALLKLGFAFMTTAFLTIGAAYAIRIIVLRSAGVEAAGLYQSAWTLGGLYVGFILQSMGTDFYPRLTAVSKDNSECNRLVNEQAQISLLLAGPGVMATLTFAPVVVAIFYSTKFAAAVPLLRWICLGMTLRVVAWPMGFIVLAKGAQKIFFWTEVAATLVHVGLAWLLVRQFGVNGAGAAFFGLYVWHGFLIYTVVRRLSGFRWSNANVRTGFLYLPLTGLVFCGFYVFPFWLALTTGALAVLVSSVYSLRAILNLVPMDRLPGAIREPLLRLGFAPSAV